MHRCLELAASAPGRTSPNPMVGAVIVSAGTIISEGFHPGAGQPHAEVIAIQKASGTDGLGKSRLYVNLEPCNHTGKTPPCCDLILSSGIPEVVVAMQDPNPLVAGSGIKRLRAHGVSVMTGMMEREARFLNRRFITAMTQNRPYIMLKWAQTKDGFVDFERTVGDGQKPMAVTSEEALTLSHKWRTEEDAIMVGSKTVMLDNPQLTARLWQGANPVRVLIDKQGIVPSDAQIFDDQAQTLCYGKNAKCPKGIPLPVLNPGKPLADLLEQLHARKIRSVLVEGGPRLHRALLEEGLWDEARIFIAPEKAGKGVRAAALPYGIQQQADIGRDHLITIYKS